MKQKHTPTQWEMSDVKNYTDGHKEIQIDHPVGTTGKEFRIIVVLSTETLCTDTFNDEDIANAEFIVRACNNHDDLLAALRDALRAFESMYDDMEQGKDFDDIFDEQSNWPMETIKAAIAKAKGQSNQRRK